MFAPLATIQPFNPKPAEAAVASSGSFFDTANQFLQTALNGYAQWETIQLMKDAGPQGLREMNQAPETPAPQPMTPAPTVQKNLYEQAASALQIGTGTLGVILVGIAVLWWLSRK